MFWKTKVRISKENHTFSSPIMCIMRIIGLFPISAHKDKYGMYLQLSPLYAVYSISLGLFFIIYACIGLYQDLVALHGLSIRMRTRTDAFVELFDWGIVHVVAACGFFVVPSKFLVFFQYRKCIEEVDAVLQTKHTERERHIQMIICLATLSAMTYQVLLDYLTYVILMGEEIVSFTILTRYGCNYLGCVIMMMVECEFQLLGSNLTKRLRMFNKVLESLDPVRVELKFKRRNTQSSFMEIRNAFKKVSYLFERAHECVGKTTKTTEYSQHDKKQISKFVPHNNRRLPEKLYGEQIDKLMKIYLKQCDALALQNKLLAISGVCAITAAFFHLIEALYFLLSDFTETMVLWYVMQVSWLLIHIVRFILIIEPYYRFSVEAERTKALVCKLQCSKVGRSVSTKLRIFTLILGLRPTKFSLAGTAVIDRTMFTSIMGYATTYLVVLLQYRKTDDAQQLNVND